MAAGHAQAARPREIVGQPAAAEVRDAREQKRQRREQAAAQQRKAEDLDQVRREPREVEVQPVAEREVHRADCVEVPAGEQRPPRRSLDTIATLPPLRLRRFGEPRRSALTFLTRGGGKGSRGMWRGPFSPAALNGPRDSLILLNPRQLVGADVRLVLRPIALPPLPPRRTHKAQDAKEHKGDT